ncbi:Mog1p/PsbP-like protein [Wallemia mellicola CBS 633.66]|uniref:Mog1p/PsbP-like protein n=2 Tax=Wallemia mellicola TaxID=1708541 RepID=I4YES4_WALMC|nr:Mog1p/PsbP-like protein [Wallemia mellicola CBS 633.66]TIB90702.1 Mog1p/PsbP-like protein [Wallemia mellicola]EIM22466.1 Mog1p/PsbP-like protein [Wallemia mellicola CBS 633.66]TIB98494.1 Mog1p/PsbP-like protein [Wallemia mellicola]TIC10211.1 Mog1p/PsbP-like protein [Wallemia mellicola]TIC26939.1 Mog1p/PsbP-like protein [Wallemia mellicola]|eukprot:XP_006957706.1 Mog1p/PsbP-like protein [Wallemia mellicola CBS 633.66]
MNKYECFDGAINFESDLNLIDASKFRQVPDNQEVFIGKDSEVSVIVEVLEHVKEAKTDEEAAKFHFDSLAYDNDCEDYSIDQPIEHLPGDKIFIVGEQKITKNDEDQKIKIALAVIRIQDKYDLKVL